MSDEQRIGGLVESQWENIYYSLDSWGTDETSGAEEDRELRRAAYFAQVEQAKKLCRITRARQLCRIAQARQLRMIADELTAMLARG